MKQNRRLLSVLLALCMIVGLIPMVASAANTTYGPSVVAGDAITDFETVSFAGAEWIVLDADSSLAGGEGMLLLAKQTAEVIAFNSNGKSSTWANSDAQAWCAAYLASLTDAEQALLDAVTKTAENTEYYGTTWTGDDLTDEKVYFLSADEVYTYFGETALVGTEYVTDTGWWLRSVDSGRDIMAGAVSDAGFVGTPHVATNYAARPALSISTQVVIATAGAKANSLSAVDELTEEPVWNLTFLNSELPSANISQDSVNSSGVIEAEVGYSELSISATYSDAVAGDKISAAIIDQMGNVLYYGQVHTVGESDTSCSISLPAGLAGKYTVQLFVERTIDGVDFASEPMTYPLFVDDGMGGVATWNINLNDNISANFWMDIPASVTEAEGAYVEFSLNGQTVNLPFDGSFSTTGYAADATPVTVDVAAAQMTDVIAITIVDGEGNRSNTYEYSVRKYADLILSGQYDDTFEKEPEVVKNLVSAMLNYGGKAQLHFGYHTDDLANKGIDITELTVGDNGWAAEIEGSADGITFAGASLVHDTRTAVRFYFTITDGATHSTNKGALIPKGDMYYVEIDGINPDQLNDLVSVTVDDSLTIQYSPMYYIERMYNRDTTKSTLKAVLSAMNTYWAAAETYVAAASVQ